MDLLQGKCVGLIKNGNGNTATIEYFAASIDPVRDELPEFIDSIRRGKTPAVSGVDGVKSP